MKRIGLILSIAVLTATAAAGRAADKAGTKDIFNGKDLTGWVAEGTKDRKVDGKSVPVWTVKDGHIFCAGSGFGFLRYERKVADFALHVEYRMLPPPPPAAGKKPRQGNSGIGIRTPAYDPKNDEKTRPSLVAYEVQLLDDAGKKPDKHCTGSLYRYVAPSAITVKPAGEWNAIDIECVGPRIRITINGTEVLDVDQTTVKEIKDKPLAGYVCLQNHGTPIEFRNLRLREIGKTEK